MFRNVGVAILCTLLLTLPALAGPDQVSKYGKVLKSAQGGLTVEMATYKQKNKHGLNDVLVRITGQPADLAGIDGQIARLEAVPGGTGFDLKYKKAGKSYNRISSRTRWGSWEMLEMYIGNQTYKLYVDDKASASLDALSLEKVFTGKKPNKGKR